MARNLIIHSQVLLWSGAPITTTRYHITPPQYSQLEPFEWSMVIFSQYHVSATPCISVSSSPAMYRIKSYGLFPVPPSCPQKFLANLDHTSSQLHECKYRRYNKQIQQLAESCCQSPLQQWCSVTLSRSHVTTKNCAFLKMHNTDA